MHFYKFWGKHAEFPKTPCTVFDTQKKSYVSQNGSLDCVSCLSSNILQRFLLFLRLGHRLLTPFKNPTLWPRTLVCHLQLFTQMQCHPRRTLHWASWQAGHPASCSSLIILPRTSWLLCSVRMVSARGHKPTGSARLCWRDRPCPPGLSIRAGSSGSHPSSSFSDSQPKHWLCFPLVSCSCYSDPVLILDECLKHRDLIWHHCLAVILFYLCYNPLREDKVTCVSKFQNCHLKVVFFTAVLVTEGG